MINLLVSFPAQSRSKIAFSPVKARFIQSRSLLKNRVKTFKSWTHEDVINMFTYMWSYRAAKLQDKLGHLVSELKRKAYEGNGYWELRDVAVGVKSIDVQAEDTKERGEWA